MKIKVLLKAGAKAPKFREKLTFDVISDQFVLYDSNYDVIASTSMHSLLCFNTMDSGVGFADLRFEIEKRVEEYYVNGFTVGIEVVVDNRYVVVELDKIPIELTKDFSTAVTFDEFYSSEVEDLFAIDYPKVGPEELGTGISAFSKFIQEVMSDRTDKEDDLKDPVGREENREETQGMNDMFGKITTDQFKLSINGLTVRGRDNKYYTYNPESRELVEVTNGFFDGMDDMLYKMPATVLEVGDIVLHQNKPYYISRVKNNVVSGIDFEESVETILIGKTNVFGMKYYTKVFNAFGTNDILGGMDNPMMLYALMGNGSNDMSKMMLMQAMAKSNDNSNPMTAMAMASAMGNDGGNGMEYIALQQMLQNQANAKTATPKAKGATE